MFATKCKKVPIQLICLSFYGAISQVTIHITSDHNFLKRTKTLEIDCYLLQNVYKFFFFFQVISTELQQIDLLTKSLAIAQFQVIVFKLDFGSISQAPGI